MQKKCFKCRKSKKPSMFYKHSKMKDGYLGKCKECQKAASRDRYNICKLDPTWKLRERERCRIKQAKARRNGLIEKYDLRYSQKWRHRNKHKSRAQCRASRAIRSKVIIKPTRCHHCGKRKKLEMHHQDYSKPLAVVFLCQPCHGLTRRIDNPLIITS